MGSEKKQSEKPRSSSKVKVSAARARADSQQRTARKVVGDSAIRETTELLVKNSMPAPGKPGKK